MKVHIYPFFRGEDMGDGGVRRVIEAQQKHLPKHGVELVETPEEADVINCHITMPSTWLNLYPDKPIVASCHGLYWSEYTWENWALDANRQVMELIRIADVVTAPSEWVAQAIRRHTMRRPIVVHHGVDLEDWEPADNYGYILWNKNRPDPVCDPYPLVQLANRLPYERFASTFVDHPIDEGRPANITELGRLPFEEAKDVVRHAAVYLATTRETFGIGTLEALASGVPVVGFDWGGQAEIPGLTLVKPLDINALTEAVKMVLDHRDDYVAGTRDIAASFSWDKAMERYVEAFELAIEKRQRPVKVSVIVTAYNLAEYLPSCLSSVERQSMKDWECIVVDDASPDDCGKIADSYAARDSRFKVIHNADNQYLAAARNTGIAASNGKYILPLDADDMLPHNAVEMLSAALDTQRSIHIAYGNVRFVEPNGQEWHSGWPMEFRHEWQLGKRNLLPYSSMFRREVWEDTCGYRSRLRTAEDADFWCRASSYGYRAAMVTKADTLIYHNREGSMSRVEEQQDWTAWFPWSKDIEKTPAGAATQKQLPVHSLEPIIISVVIPVGPDHDQVVINAVDSVDAQTYRHWECVVVNDSGKPLTRLPSWVRIVSTEGGTGVAHARNVGIAAAKGKLILPLDADDYLQPECLDQMVVAHDRFDGVIYSDWWEDPEVEGQFTTYEPPDFDPALLITNGAIHAVTSLFPKAVWEKVGGYDETLSGWEDWAFQIACAEACVCSTHVKAPLWTYQKWAGFRREQNQAAFEDSKKDILRRFGEYWNGRRLMAGCNSCGGGRSNGTPPPSVSASAMAAPAISGETALLEYVGPAIATATYRGLSGQLYYFSNSAGDNIKMVLREDVDGFLRFPEFRVFQGTPPNGQEIRAPVLAAPGPPRRANEPVFQDAPEPRRRRGRPKGSRNRKTIEREEQAKSLAALAEKNGYATVDD